MRIRSNALAILTMALLCAESFCTSPPAPPPVPEEELDRVQLPRDADHLIELLEKGIPPDFALRRRDGDGIDTSRFLRWSSYQFMIPALANLNPSNPRALDALRRILAGTLSPVMQADCDIAVASRNQYPTWEEWDRLQEIEIDRLKMEAAVALYRLSGEPAKPLLMAQIEHWSHVISTVPEGGEVRRPMFQLVLDACDYLTRIDALTAVDTLLTLLDSSDYEVRASAAGELQGVTRQWIGPFHDSPYSTAMEDTAKWKSWWAVHRETFMAGEKESGLKAPGLAPLPAPVTLRDHLRQTIEGGGIVLTDNDSEQWLSEHAVMMGDELLAIARDVDERHGIRAQALEYFTKSHRDLSFDTLIEALQDRTETRYPRFHSDALELIKELHPERYFETIEACVDQDWPCARAAADDVYYSGSVIPRMASKLTRLTPPIQKVVLERLFYLPQPPPEAMELALAGNDAKFAASAVRAAANEAVRSQLTPAALERLKIWEKDPWCRYEMVYLKPRSQLREQDMAEAMDAQQGVAPPAATVYSVAMSRFGFRRALDEFVSCVDAYRESRGRPQPLSEFGYSWMR